ncbi:MAG: hypothetical protein EHM78_01895 [Myxococcaceae bacterium]|nr:MAG: hypothetical protein EHM78_01895 [Myxococcaceae bacterium]
MATPFEFGRMACLSGLSQSANPHVTGHTKLGAPKLSEDGVEWASGWASVPRAVSKADEAAARRYDLSPYRRKSNRYYR